MNGWMQFFLIIWLGTGALIVLNNFANILKGRRR